MVRWSAAVVKFAPNCCNINSVWLRVGSCSMMVEGAGACRAAKIKALLTWAEATVIW